MRCSTPFASMNDSSIPPIRRVCDRVLCCTLYPLPTKELVKNRVTAAVLTFGANVSAGNHISPFRRFSHFLYSLACRSIFRTLKVVAKSYAGDKPGRRGVAWLSKSKKSTTMKLAAPADSDPGSNSAPTTQTFTKRDIIRIRIRSRVRMANRDFGAFSWCLMATTSKVSSTPKPGGS